MEIQKSKRVRRHHSEEFKLAVIAACCEPGSSVAGIALANGVNANQVRRWMRERGVEPPTRRLPIQAVETLPAFVPVPMPAVVAESHNIQIEIRRNNTANKLDWPLQASAECAAWLRDWLR